MLGSTFKVPWPGQVMVETVVISRDKLPGKPLTTQQRTPEVRDEHEIPCMLRKLVDFPFARLLIDDISSEATASTKLEGQERK